MRFRTLVAGSAMAVLLPSVASVAHADSSASEFSRFGTLLRHGAQLEAAGRGVSAWSLIGTGAGMGVVGGFMLVSDDDATREAGVWMGGSGIAVAALGLIPLFTRGQIEDLHSLWEQDSNVSPEQRGDMLARYEASLRDMANDAATIRVVSSVVTAVASAAMLGIGIGDMVVQDEVTSGGASLAITGGFGLALGLYGAVAGQSSTESLWEAWDKGRPAPDEHVGSVTFSPGIGIRPDGFVLGLGGSF
jgi:hypothetical protein